MCWVDGCPGGFLSLWVMGFRRVLVAGGGMALLTLCAMVVEM
jgi:hypothetical protein